MRKILFSSRFADELEKILVCIAQDKPMVAKKFKNALLNKINAITQMPFSYRKSLASEDDNARELIFKGFVVVFVVDTDSINVLGIYKSNLWR